MFKPRPWLMPDLKVRATDAAHFGMLSYLASRRLLDRGFPMQAARCQDLSRRYYAEALRCRLLLIGSPLSEPDVPKPRKPRKAALETALSGRPPNRRSEAQAATAQETSEPLNAPPSAPDQSKFYQGRARVC
jgi:hypothetical protein